MLLDNWNVLQGNISLELYWAHAPKTCRNFAELVSYYVDLLLMFLHLQVNKLAEG